MIPTREDTEIQVTDPFRPYERLVKIKLLKKTVEVPEKNSLLRCFQFLSPETIPYGRFCWNQDCQYCRVMAKLPDDDKPTRNAELQVPGHAGNGNYGDQPRTETLPPACSAEVDSSPQPGPLKSAKILSIANQKPRKRPLRSSEGGEIRCAQIPPPLVTP